MVAPDGVHTVFENDVLYSYADIGEHQLMHISCVNEDNRRSHFYKCPYCHLELRPRLGANKQHCFAHNEECGPSLVRYILSSNLEAKWEEQITCLNYKESRMQPGVLFEIVCRQQDFNTPNDFIKYGNTLAARYELIGTCRRFKPGYSTPFIRDYSMSECPRFCRFFNINGVLTEETKRYNGYPVYNPKLP